MHHRLFSQLHTWLLHTRHSSAYYFLDSGSSWISWCYSLGFSSSIAHQRIWFLWYKLSLICLYLCSLLFASKFMSCKKLSSKLAVYVPGCGLETTFSGWFFKNHGSRNFFLFHGPCSLVFSEVMCTWYYCFFFTKLFQSFDFCRLRKSWSLIPLTFAFVTDVWMSLYLNFLHSHWKHFEVSASQMSQAYKENHLCDLLPKSRSYSGTSI